MSGRVRASSAVLVVGCKPAPRRVGEPDRERAMRLPPLIWFGERGGETTAPSFPGLMPRGWARDGFAIITLSTHQKRSVREED